MKLISWSEGGGKKSLITLIPSAPSHRSWLCLLVLLPALLERRMDWMSSLPTFLYSEKGTAGGRHLSPSWPSRPAPTSNAPFTERSMKALETRSAQFHANNPAHLNRSHGVCSHQPGELLSAPQQPSGIKALTRPWEHQAGQRSKAHAAVRPLCPLRSRQDRRAQFLSEIISTTTFGVRHKQKTASLRNNFLREPACTRAASRAP